MLEVQNLSKTYNPGKKNALAALHDVSLTIADGEMVAVTGTSGAGKSTLLHILGGVLSFDTGSYHLDGEEVSLPDHPAYLLKRGAEIGRSLFHRQQLRHAQGSSLRSSRLL